jgi:hypothetical protein
MQASMRAPQGVDQITAVLGESLESRRTESNRTLPPQLLCVSEC